MARASPYDMGLLMGDLRDYERVLDYIQLVLGGVAYASRNKWQNLLQNSLKTH